MGDDSAGSGDDDDGSNDDDGSGDDEDGSGDDDVGTGDEEDVVAWSRVRSPVDGDVDGSLRPLPPH